MRITLIISSLSSGGAERVMSIVANYWAEQGQDITLITIDSEQNDFYALDTRIHRVALNLKESSPTHWSAIKNNMRRLYRLRSEIKRSRSDVILSFIDRMNVVTLVATIGLCLPVIVSEHIDPRQLPPGGIWNYLRRWTYSWANAVVVLTSELSHVVGEFVSESRIYVIPNPAISTKKNVSQKLALDLPSPFVVAMGRLQPQKGFDFLLEAFAHCKYKDWSLVILGEGPEREKLESQISRLGLGARVCLAGRVNDPSIVLRRADLFVLSSRFEGFPMAILEAMSCGLPVISFDCPTGPNEIINDGIDGVLVPVGDVVALSSEINRLIEDESERKRLASNARNVVDRFSIEKVMAQWDNLLKDVIK